MPAVPRLLGHLSRRQLLAGVGALGAAGLLTACGGGSTPPPPAAGPAPAGAFPLTVEHSKGATEIKSAPQRVVTVGFSDQDPVLAMGVRPVAVTDWYGDHPYATWPWAQDELGDAQPVVLNRGAFTGTPDYRYEEIAALSPDLIVGLYTSMDDTQYQTLSRIAPTVAPPAGYPEWGAPWDEYTRLAGRALGVPDRAEQLITGVNAQLEAAAAANPRFEGRTAVVAERFEGGQSFVRSPNDPRSQLVAALGFTIPPEIGELAGDMDGATISDEQMALLDRDVLLWNTGFSPEVREDIERAPLYSRLNVVEEGRAIFVDDPMVSAAWTWGTVLSLPTVIDALVGKISAVLT
ncbi:iron complex transport system substrate-binding protein [Pseudonocardia hierapolitana]|uniref:Iron complex transport system substrate-binding protein n=1 Tax=Pseudonocardia hierapolitana TaxID=1128676 RepID=A0A561SUC8_9PSEU|nr:iron-siderophore ABC transporter substrate-binding protein [Pseudonocardia hierapolitana]TWF78462.1 iron complex transport system substrate-binding protein [Pseudonocardia hierapolitana]